MKRMLLFLVSVATFGLHIRAADSKQSVQPYTAVFWTTATLHSPTGKASTFTRRTVYTRDAAGNTRTERYQPTKGSLQDLTAPLERISTVATTAQAPLPAAHRSGETVQVVDLGNLLFSGFPTLGSRQIFRDSNGLITHTLETWFCPSIGLITHMVSSSAKGDTLNGDILSLQLEAPVEAAAATASMASKLAAPTLPPAFPAVALYRNLFTLVNRMEQERQANDPTRHVNMVEIEDHLRQKLQISPAEWQVLVAVSARVEEYTHEKHDEARTLVRKEQDTRKANSLGPNTSASSHAMLRKMQSDLNTHIQGEIDGFSAAVSPSAASHTLAYLQGPFAASTRAVPLHAAHLPPTGLAKQEAQ